MKIFSGQVFDFYVYMAFIFYECTLICNDVLSNKCLTCKKLKCNTIAREKLMSIKPIPITVDDVICDVICEKVV